MKPPGARFTVAGCLVMCAIATELCVSANLLTWAGIPYSTDGGALPLKIHPGTYVVCSAYFVHCAAQTRPNGVFWAAIGQNRYIAAYLGAMSSCLCYAGLTTGKGNLIVLIDTFVPAGLLAAVAQGVSVRDLSGLRRLLQCGVAANAALALVEAAAHASLVPLYLNHAEYHARIEEFRPTALYDHPLTGGVMTMIGLALPPARLWLRVPYIGLLFAALLAFGGRVSVAAVLVSWLFLAGTSVGKSVLRRDPHAVHLLLSFMLICLFGAAFLAVALSAGMGPRLAGHLYWDPSAQVRLAQWHLIGRRDVVQLLFGTARKDLLALLAPLWLSYGVEVIENFWLLIFASLGAVGFSIFLVGFLCLLAWCWTRADLRGRVLIVAFVFVASGSNSLGRKSTLLVGLVAAISCMAAGPTRGRRQVSAVARPGLSPGMLMRAS